MLVTIGQYAGFNEQVGFLKFKQAYLSNTVWKTAFYIHVFSCFVCLLAGFSQFSKSLLERSKKIHRFLGRVYAYNILLINVPAGFILAIYANGLFPSRLAFLTLDILWFTFTLKGVMYIRNGNTTKHKAFMIRSYALTLSAFSLRLWKYGFVTFTDLDPDSIYMIDAWLGFVPNLLIAEWIIRRNQKKLTLETNLINDNDKS